MVSGFYLWMPVLTSIGKKQEWITRLEPRYQVDKYCLEDETTMDDYKDRLKPVQTRWTTGFVHGNSFEERVVTSRLRSRPPSKYAKEGDYCFSQY
jgi:hypothetical protein